MLNIKIYGLLCILIISFIISSTQVNATDGYVMLPLDSVVENNGELSLKNSTWLREQFQELKRIGMKGVMSDCWWGLVEKEAPTVYNFQPYIEMTKIAREEGIKIQMVMSFHRCGGNVGDTCWIPLPKWIKRDDVWYKNSRGSITKEYISLWADHEKIDIYKRTPMDMYEQFMKEFHNQIAKPYVDVISEVQIGAGPCGELRYPSYQLEQGWDYCGIGEFQSFDNFALASVAKAAKEYKREEYGRDGGPIDARNANCRPNFDRQEAYCDFFSHSSQDNYQSDYGKFFLTWYSDSLIQHGKHLGRIGRQVFGPKMALSIKVAGVHWWYNTPHHGAELTAGYYNTNGNDGYGKIAKSFQESNLIFCFTCLEMKTDHHDNHCHSNPQALVHQTRKAVKKHLTSISKSYAGENALEVVHSSQIDLIAHNARNAKSFTWLRLHKETNWYYLETLVQKLKKKSSKSHHHGKY